MNDNQNIASELSNLQNEVEVMDKDLRRAFEVVARDKNILEIQTELALNNIGSLVTILVRLVPVVRALSAEAGLLSEFRDDFEAIAELADIGRAQTEDARAKVAAERQKIEALVRNAVAEEAGEGVEEDDDFDDMDAVLRDILKSLFPDSDI